MFDSYDNQMPRSVSDALSRLQGMLKESELPQEVIEAILRYVEEEMKQSSDNQRPTVEMGAHRMATGRGRNHLCW